MSARLALLGLVLVAGLGGAAGAVPQVVPAVSAPGASVEPLPWTLAGNVRDYMCPDSLALPMHVQAPNV